MRQKLTSQLYLDCTRKSNLKMVQKFRKKYEKIDRILRENPAILDLVHRDLSRSLSTSDCGRSADHSSDAILRSLVVMFVEDKSYRDVTVLIDECDFLRRFVGLGMKDMMDHTFLCRAFGVLRAETCKKMNALLTEYAMEQEKISGENLRVDTTVVETNIHYPTDSTLLWDSWRTLVRILRAARDEHPTVCANNRFHDRRVKRLFLKIQRHAKSTSKRTQQKVRTAYRELIDAVQRVLRVSEQAVQQLGNRNSFSKELFHFQPLVEWVIDQAERRVFHGEKIPADEKLYSIFEEHTQLIKRGKARSPIEFGHRILVGQTKEKFITQYDVVEEGVTDKDLVDDILASHKKTFKKPPDVFAADKGFYENMEKIHELEEDIRIVSICKKGGKNQKEWERETDKEFKLGQSFRAGVEGTISVLKRVFKLGRCLFKGFKNYRSSIGCAIFSHNLVALTRL